jgi:5-(carboxyamino)imidazole ribonucleotide synthase
MGDSKKMRKTVGVIGGGQLAWMMAQVAPTENVDLWVQTPSKEDSAVNLAHGVIYGEIASAEATAQLAEHCDVITFENEFVDLTQLQKLAEKGVCFYPRLSSLSPLLDKYEQRCFLQAQGLPVPRFSAYEHDGDCDAFSFPLVLKARRHGYDGQGTVIVKSEANLQQRLNEFQDTPLLIEEFVPFEKELAVIVARSVTGEIKIYPTVETYQQAQVCHWVMVPTQLNPRQINEIETIATKLVEALDYVGVLAIELFLTQAGNILINEIAPRTHNSGHYTLDACETSQFAMQLQAVTGQKLGNVNLKCNGAVMVNLLGYETSHSDYLAKRKAIADLGVYVHWYGKSDSRVGRKLGHVTALLTSLTPTALETEGKEIITQIESRWYPEKMPE